MNTEVQKTLEDLKKNYRNYLEAAHYVRMQNLCMSRSQIRKVILRNLNLAKKYRMSYRNVEMTYAMLGLPAPYRLSAITDEGLVWVGDYMSRRGVIAELTDASPSASYHVLAFNEKTGRYEEDPFFWHDMYKIL